MQTKNTKQGGFTLVEIAIVLVIIGLLLGGILKGQELINNAKVRSVADRQNSLKAAWFGFIDRYNFIPGDSRRAVQLVPGAEARILSTTQPIPGDGRLTLGESVLAMNHLRGAGFLRCPQCNGGVDADNTTNTNASILPSAENSLVNQYSGVMSIWNEANQYAYRASADGTASPFGRLQIHSGPRIPSNILSEVDRKIDDGLANSGDMVFNGFDPVASAYSAGAIGSEIGPPAPTVIGPCMNTVNADGTFDDFVNSLRSEDEVLWRSSDATGGAVENNCGASVFI